MTAQLLADQTITAALNDKLGRHVSDLRVTINEENVLTLSGTTSKYYIKQMAQEEVKNLIPVICQIVNTIRVE